MKSVIVQQDKNKKQKKEDQVVLATQLYHLQIRKKKRKEAQPQYLICWHQNTSCCVLFPLFLSNNVKLRATAVVLSQMFVSLPSLLFFCFFFSCICIVSSDSFHDLLKICGRGNFDRVPHPAFLTPNEHAPG